MNAPLIPPIKVPEPLFQLKGYLVWKFVQKPGEQKPRKVPFYHDGHHRSGKQGGADDRVALGTFKQASAKHQKGGFDGIGLAMLREFGIVALDFDNCIIDDQIMPEVLELIGDTYSEISPSGNGIRAFMRGTLPSRKSPTKGNAFGFETFHENGFVTITGNPTWICDLVGNQDIICDVTPGTGVVRGAIRGRI